MARAVLNGDRGELQNQLDRPDSEWPEPEELRAEARARARCRRSGRRRRASARPAPTALGGFADDGREYVIVLDGDQETPLPWSNVIANPDVRNGGHGLGLGLHLVAEQPREPPHAFRERPRDRPDGRGALRPRRRDGRDVVAHSRVRFRARRRVDGRFVIRHSAGLTRFARVTHGLRQELDVFVDAQDPVKFSLLTLTNESGRAASAERLRLQRVGPGTAAGRPGPTCADRARLRHRARSWRGIPTTRSSRDAWRSRTRAKALRSATGDRSRSWAATAPWRSRRRFAAKRCRAASERGSIPARRCRSPSSWPRGRHGGVVFLLGQGKSLDEARALLRRHGGVEAAEAAREAVRCDLGRHPRRGAGRDARTIPSTF